MSDNPQKGQKVRQRPGVPLFARIPPQLHRTLRLLCAEEGRPVSELVRELLVEYVEGKIKAHGGESQFLVPDSKEKS